MQMLSPPNPYFRHPPPVRPSRSLEGLEVVVPPGTFFVSRSDLSVGTLNKPLPAKPLPDTPERTSSLYSTDSLIDSYIYRTRTETSTDEYHIPVASAPNESVEAITRPATAGTVPTRPSLAQISRDKVSSLSLKAFMTQERYGTDIHARIKAGPYFREKKWDFFPELASPSGLQATAYGAQPHRLTPKARRRFAGPRSPASLPASLEAGKSSSRWLSSENGGLLLGHSLRDSIRTYVHKALSRKRSLEKGKQKAAVPSNYPYRHPPSRGASDSSVPSSDGRSGFQQSLVDVYERMRTLSISPGSSSGSDRGGRASTPQGRRKPLAVPMPPYQKYGSQSWETPHRPRSAIYRKGPNVVFPKYPRRTSSMIEIRDCSYVNPTPPLSPPLHTQIQQHTQQYVRALHNGTSQVMSALDEAKKKITETKADRRRAALKKQIKMVGPTDLYGHAGVSYLL